MKFLFFTSKFILIVLVILSMQILVVQASSSTSISFTVNNSAPVASNVIVTNAVGGNVNLTSGTTTTTTVTFTVTDNNGCEEIDSGSPDTDAIFYRTNVTNGIACTPDSANCYNMSCAQDGGSCTPGGSDLTATYTCTASVQFYADPTDAGSAYSSTTWTAGVTPADGAGAGSANTSTTVEIVSLTALSVTATIAYDNLALNANTGSTDEITTITNTGNRVIDVEVGGYGSSTGDDKALNCTVGSVAVANEKYSLVASTAYASKTALPADDNPDTVSLNLAVGASSTDDIYWGMGLPVSNVGGSCTGHVAFTAVNYIAPQQYSSGPNSPGTMATVLLEPGVFESCTEGYISDWADSSNATSSNNSYASFEIANDSCSYYLKATNFGFDIPTGATIDGIKVEIEKYSVSFPFPILYSQDIFVGIVKGGTISSTNKSTGADLPASDAYGTYGGSSEKWGTTWTAEDINSSNFGVAYIALNQGASDAYVDHIRITVYYTQ